MGKTFECQNTRIQEEVTLPSMKLSILGVASQSQTEHYRILWVTSSSKGTVKKENLKEQSTYLIATLSAKPFTENLAEMPLLTTIHVTPAHIRQLGRYD